MMIIGLIIVTALLGPAGLIGVIVLLIIITPIAIKAGKKEKEKAALAEKAAVEAADKAKADHLAATIAAAVADALAAKGITSNT